jgi:2-polyprenyl-3-methyl-5-hydroxy-6-metoxy-1,4-benzoquinol methylase
MTTTQATTKMAAEQHAAQAAQDEADVFATLETLVDELASAGFVSMVAIGDRLGLYSALRFLGPSTAGALADATGCNERLVFEWLCANAAAGYLSYDTDTERFGLAAGAAAVLADPNSPVFLAPAASVIRAYYTDLDLLEEAFRGDGGIGWDRHHHAMFHSVERYFAAAYAANLTSTWIPAVPGLTEKLTAGARVADVGCGHGISTAIMAAHYPASEFYGVDFHEPSIRRAEQVACERGLEGRIDYDVATATDYAGGPFDVICFFDALHDMGDPEAAIRHARSQLADDGTLFLVEMYAADSLEDKLASPLGRWTFAASTVLCTPAALAQEGRLALGNQAGSARLGELLTANGFGSYNVAMETPFNIILEARP